VTPIAADLVERERALVVMEARSWIGTPYHVGAKIKSVGVDCAQLLVAVYESLGLVEDVQLAPYNAGWFLHHSDELFLAGIAAYCHRVGGIMAPQLPGDILLFRYGRAVSHGGIIASAGSVVHAERRTGVVTLEECGPGSAMSGKLDSVWRINRWRVAVPSLADVDGAA